MGYIWVMWVRCQRLINISATVHPNSMGLLPLEWYDLMMVKDTSAIGYCHKDNRLGQTSNMMGGNWKARIKANPMVLMA